MRFDVEAKDGSGSVKSIPVDAIDARDAVNQVRGWGMTVAGMKQNGKPVPLPQSQAKHARNEAGAINAASAMIMSSGDICRPYEVIKLVTSYASAEQSFSGAVSGAEAYAAALMHLQNAGVREGADAVIYVNVQSNRGVARALLGEVQMIEVFCWGTAVRFCS